MIHWRSSLRSAFFVALGACVLRCFLTPSPARADDLAITPANDPHPTLVTLHMSNASLADITTKIASQTAMPVSVGIGNPTSSLSIDADQQPFWNVLDDLCKRSNTSIIPMWNNTSGITLVPGAGQPGQRIISGPVMLMLQNIQHLSGLTAAPERQDFCELSGQAIWEPRLKVLFTDAWTIPTVAVDENGLSLVPDEATAASDPRQPQNQQTLTGQFAPQQRFNPNDLFRRDLHIRLHIPPNAGRTIKTLSGQWRFFVAKKTDHFDIPAVATAKRRSTFALGDLATLTLQGSQANDEMVQIQLTAPAPPQGTSTISAEMAKRNSLLQSIEARVLDADGQPWGDTSGGDFNGGQVNVMNGGNQLYVQIYIRRSASAKGKPAKVTIEGPVAATEIDAPFTLHDLPLP